MNDPHWSDSYVKFLRQVAPELADVPIYLLRNDEHPVEWVSHWMAMFSPLSDLKAQSTLERLGLWSGRGVCVIVRNDFAAWSTRCQAGTLLHEMSHGIEHITQPHALATELSPICREWLEVGESKMLADAGIDRNDLIRGQHGSAFVRLCCHLHQRARGEMHLTASDLQFLHRAYSLPPERYEDVVEALRSELAMTRNLNLLRLREAPATFLELFK